MDFLAAREGSFPRLIRDFPCGETVCNLEKREGEKRIPEGSDPKFANQVGVRLRGQIQLPLPLPPSFLLTLARHESRQSKGLAQAQTRAATTSLLCDSYVS